MAAGFINRISDTSGSLGSAQDTSLYLVFVSKEAVLLLFVCYFHHHRIFLLSKERVQQAGWRANIYHIGI